MLGVRPGRAAFAVTTIACTISCGNSGSGARTADAAPVDEDAGAADATLGASDCGYNEVLCFSCSGVPSCQVNCPAFCPVNVSPPFGNCPGPLSPSVAATLMGDAGADPSMKWLYPYDGTVFPAGLAAPTLQWEQDVAPDAVYVHMSSKRFAYEGCFAGSTPPRVTLPANAWAAAFAQNDGPGDPLTVAITTSAAGAVRGPIVETWTFAKGSLKDVVYYDTYTSALAGDRAAVMAIDPRTGHVSTLLTDPSGTTASGSCVSCHAASANGQLVVAQRSTLTLEAGTTFLESDSYDLSDGAAPHLESPLARIATASWALGGMYPDGSRVLTNGQPGAPDAGQLGVAGNDPGLPGPSFSALYDPRTGAPLPSSGLDGAHAMMPAFSPDGATVVFNDADHGAGHTLAVMDFDAATNAFSNRRELFRDDGAYPGWPAFTPDSKRVVFVDGTSNEFATVDDVADAAGIAGGDLMIVDLATSVAHAMDATNGNRDGGSYLPNPARNADLSFYPSVSPVAAGAYFWVYFTSAREYGNSSSLDAGAGSGKQIWVAAIDTGCATGDGSHPAFLLPGQELTSRNFRPVAALPPCMGAGASCLTGIDCCTGSCDMGKCGVAQTCAGEDGRCTPTVPCCSTTSACINGFCAPTTSCSP